MTMIRSDFRGLAQTRSLLNRLIEMPELAGTIQALPPRTFSTLIRRVGVEDAGELIGLATSEQLVQAFDEDLFGSDRPGERETFDASRFVVWLEVLLEAGEEVAANRIATLDEDFVAHALSKIVFVLDEEALRQSLEEGDEDAAWHIDKALESALTEDLDGYILFARQHDGWDAVLSLILALDRDHRVLLVRLLDRLAAVSSSLLDDLDELWTVLTEAESLADDVEAAREERRGKQGYVEARAARGFLEWARGPLGQEEMCGARDPLTRAYFRDLELTQSDCALPFGPSGQAVRALPESVRSSLEQMGGLDSSLSMGESPSSAMRLLMGALQKLGETAPEVFGQRLSELAYLANVLVAGHERDGQRMTPRNAANAALSTVGFGAFLQARNNQRGRTTTQDDLLEVVRKNSPDALFRVASSTLARGAADSAVEGSRKSGVLYTEEELEAAIEEADAKSAEGILLPE